MLSRPWCLGPHGPASSTWTAATTACRRWTPRFCAFGQPLRWPGLRAHPRSLRSLLVPPPTALALGPPPTALALGPPLTALALGPPALRVTPNIVKLDLTGNRIEVLANLHTLSELQYLNLSYNRIARMDDAVRTLGNVATLILRGNQLSSIRGLERLLGLIRLDVRENCLTYGAQRATPTPTRRSADREPARRFRVCGTDARTL